jgi:hypothetical protein
MAESDGVRSIGAWPAAAAHSGGAEKWGPNNRFLRPKGRAAADVETEKRADFPELAPAGEADCYDSDHGQISGGRGTHPD